MLLLYNMHGYWGKPKRKAAKVVIVDNLQICKTRLPQSLEFARFSEHSVSDLFGLMINIHANTFEAN